MVAATLLGALLVVGCLEIAARLSRAADYILYVRSETIGFIPKPNASGTMRNKYRWHINARGMRADCNEDIAQDSIVLVGDSIVEGGSHIDQCETLGHLLERAVDRRVHPAGAGSWALPNEIAFILENQDLLKAGTLILVTNSDDLGGLNVWSSATTHPTDRPQWHSLYLLRRAIRVLLYGVQARFRSNSPNPGNEEDWQAPVQELLKRFDGRLIWVLYPSRSELSQGVEPCVRLRQFVEGRAECLDLSGRPGWTTECYRDQLHPSSIGRRTLAAILAAAVRS